MKTIIANKQTIVNPRANYFLGPAKGEVVTTVWALDGYLMTAIYFANCLYGVCTVKATIATFNHN